MAGAANDTGRINPVILHELPLSLAYEFRSHAGMLLRELAENYLDVIKVPAPEQCHSGHGVRLVINRNPAWYRDLYHNHSGGKFARHLLLAAFRKIESGEATGRKYELIAFDLIRELLLSGYGEIPPSVKAENYFLDEIPF